MKPILKSPAVPAPTRIGDLYSKEVYRPQWQPMRVGADQHERIPSRRAGERVWRDGKREAT